MEEIRKTRKDFAFAQFIAEKFEEEGEEAYFIQNEAYADINSNPLARGLYGTPGLELIGKVYWFLAPDLRKQARSWAARTIVNLVKSQVGTAHKLYHYRSVKPKDEIFLEIDIDGTIEALLDDPLNPFETVRVFERKTGKSSIILLIDNSFSMSGKKLVMAAMAGCTLAYTLNPEEYCVIAFSTKPKILKRFQEPLPPVVVVNRILGLIPKGYTDIDKALRTALKELSKEKNKTKRCILMSDCDPTTGKNPLVVASRFDNLHIVFNPKGGNEWFAETLAREGKGTMVKVSKISDIPKSLTKILHPKKKKTQKNQP